MTQEAPSATELQANPVVQAAFAAAWADSLADDANLRHEEGGWIYLEPDAGVIHIRRASPGDRWGVDLTHPPVLAGCFLVATYHTHPNLSAEGWQPGPSEIDRDLAHDSGVPWFIVADVGVFATGPDRRVGGLGGLPGYPI
jgi:hypothetical protein